MRRRLGLILLSLAIAFGGRTIASGQEASPHQHPEAVPAQPPSTHAADGHEPHSSGDEPPAHAGHNMAAMEMFVSREASGTAWLPDATPMYGVQATAGPWSLMLHGNAFAQFLNESGARGAQQAGSVNWVMGMARRHAGAGQLGLRAMFSVEPWTIGGCGYPDLLASGESCAGEAIHDRQHPHDFWMELAAEYRRPIRGSLQWEVYGGPAAEPALGPVAYPHRASAMANPLAPIAHHWLDATHISFGVVTAGVFSRTWKIEGSAFNGREPDEHRANIELAPFDSYSARVWFLPTPRLAFQISAGHLEEAEAGHAGQDRTDVDRITASANYQRAAGNWQWASAAAFGRNKESDPAGAALLLETSLSFRDRDTWFGRVEWAEKAAHDLDIHDSSETFTVAKLQLGYTAYFAEWRRLNAGFGGGLSFGVVPKSLETIYGHRVNPGVALFLTVRPSAHQMAP
jgi:hypothetical protein